VRSAARFSDLDMRAVFSWGQLPVAPSQDRLTCCPIPGLLDMLPRPKTA